MKIFLQRLWLYLDGYCWPHTTRFCASCRDDRDHIRYEKYLANLDRKHQLAYEIRLKRSLDKTP